MLPPSQFSRTSRLARITTHSTPIRSFSIAIPARKADAESPKPRGFLAEKDGYSRREQAYEGLYVKAHEAERLFVLRRKMKEQRRQLEELDRSFHAISKGQPSTAQV
ncbi:hypothetical protein ASPWEDRAFT_177501 [Aspergillus wentii DTO 134E9]|uniref:ATPase inhibitor, mitochondrial n=1 Tax=Aspergillus wentii DTO 134E9 TaxID=1073089 RepID=A0A1L9R4D0_ASPWE|nr:uncharacterized protein ASPWEDRAFT_177501 [Aspergillus wentii DTO 134E9]KAI9927043.1 hypothetical protein MW887_003424 [Aspergillus wentii]OJJ29760.1 hypothetical protein ASPWEDRAFT_177501 [Aspergillus wentii DTO 134E9]